MERDRRESLVEFLPSGPQVLLFRSSVGGPDQSVPEIVLRRFLADIDHPVVSQQKYQRPPNYLQTLPLLPDYLLAQRNCLRPWWDRRCHLPAQTVWLPVKTALPEAVSVEMIPVHRPQFGR